MLTFDRFMARSNLLPHAFVWTIYIFIGSIEVTTVAKIILIGNLRWPPSCLCLLYFPATVNDSQFGFVPGRGTTDAIFVDRQLQEKYLAANKGLYMVSVDLEKAFDRVPWNVIWWALRKLGVEESIVRLVQGMYANARSRVCVGKEHLLSL